MSILSRLFGGGGAKSTAEPVLHKDYRIYPEPTQEQGGHRITARIEREIDGETRTHTMIRADKCQSMDEAVETSTYKAKMLIDQQGDSIFQ